MRFYQTQVRVVMSNIFLVQVKLRINGVLNLDHLQGAFIMLVLLLGAAFFVLLLERFTCRPSSP